MKPTIDTACKRLLLLLVVAGLTLGAAARADDGEQAQGKATKIAPHVVVADGGHGFLGVELTSLTPELREHFGVPREVGVMIGGVEEDSPAAAAGLRVGDIITRLDDEEIRSAARLARTVHQKKKGDVVAIEYSRGGRVETVSATLDERKRLVYDLGRHFEWTEDLDKLIELKDLDELIELRGHGVEIGQEAMERAAEALRQAFENQDWEVYLRQLEDVDFKAVEERMEELKERLEELEQRIEREVERSTDEL